jgi:hypothetical protein
MWALFEFANKLSRRDGPVSLVFLVRAARHDFQGIIDRGAAAPSPYPMARIHASRSASEGRPVKINSARDRCAPPSRKLLPELSVESHALEGSGKTGKASHMKKTVLALATAATVGFATLAAPSPAHAWRGGVGVPVSRPD